MFTINKRIEMLRVSAAIISAAYAISLEKKHPATTKPAPGTIKPLIVEGDKLPIKSDYDDQEPFFEPEFETCEDQILELQLENEHYEGSPTQELDELYGDILEAWNNSAKQEEFLDWAMNFRYDESKPHVMIHYSASEHLS